MQRGAAEANEQDVTEAGVAAQQGIAEADADEAVQQGVAEAEADKVV